MSVKNIAKWRNEISITHENFENVHYRIKKNDQKNHYMKYQLKDDNEYKKIINIRNMRKSQVEKNALIINVENTIQKNKKHDENLKNQNIMLKKKNIIDISIYKIQKKWRYAFNHDAWTSK